MNGMNNNMNNGGNGMYSSQIKGTSIIDILKQKAQNNGSNGSNGYQGNSYNGSYQQNGYNNYGNNGMNGNHNMNNGMNHNVNNMNNMNNGHGYNMQNSNGYQNQYHNGNTTDTEDSYIGYDKNMSEVADNVNQKLASDKKKRRRRKRKSEPIVQEEIEEIEETEVAGIFDNPVRDSVMFDISISTILEPILLLTIYVIMSQPFVVTKASEILPYLNPDTSGTIPMIGIILYGSLMVMLFMVLRFLLVN
jgi:hypothetical protein